MFGKMKLFLVLTRSTLEINFIFPHIHILIGSSLKKITYLMYRNDPLSGFVEQLLVIRNVCSIFYSFSHYVVEAKP